MTNAVPAKTDAEKPKARQKVARLVRKVSQSRVLRFVAGSALFVAALWYLFAHVITDAHLTLEYARAMLWPGVVLLTLFWLRGPLREKLRELLKIEGFGALAQFQEQRTRQFADELGGPIGTLAATATDPDETPPDPTQPPPENHGKADVSTEPMGEPTDSSATVDAQSEAELPNGSKEGSKAPEADEPNPESDWPARIEDLLQLSRALGLKIGITQKDIEIAPENTYRTLVRWIESRANELREQRNRAAHSTQRTRDGIEEIIRTSADWGYDMAKSGAPKTVPDVVWKSDDTWQIVTVPERLGKSTIARATRSIAKAEPDPKVRTVKALEDEIKQMEKAKHGPVGKFNLDPMSGNAGWLRELKKRLYLIDPTNPWAQP